MRWLQWQGKWVSAQHLNYCLCTRSSFCFQRPPIITYNCSSPCHICYRLIRYTCSSPSHIIYCVLLYVCSNSKDLQDHQLFLMSLICNVHPNSILLDFIPPIPAPLQQQLAQYRQQQQQKDGLGFGGPEVMYQYPEQPDGGPVVAGTEAPGQYCQWPDCLSVAACVHFAEGQPVLYVATKVGLYPMLCTQCQHTSSVFRGRCTAEGQTTCQTQNTP